VARLSASFVGFERLDVGDQFSTSPSTDPITPVARFIAACRSGWIGTKRQRFDKPKQAERQTDWHYARATDLAR
jgi:hypothetical protein